jgi:imidazolonepropionase-like amidohydrolase
MFRYLECGLRTAWRGALATVALALFAAPSFAAEPHAYCAGRIWPGNGPVIVDGVLVVADGKVTAVGRRADVTVPADAVVHDLGDAVVIPGLVVAETTLAEKGRDDLHTLTPEHRAIDGFDPFADYSAVLAGGVTTVQLSPGGKRLLPGQGAVVKLFGHDPGRRTLRDDESLRIVLGGAFKGAPRVYEPPVGAVSVDKPLEPTRPQLAESLAGAVSGLRATFEAAKAANGAAPSDPFLRAVSSYGSVHRPVRVSAPTPADVRAALGLAAAFNLKLILTDVGNLGPFRDHLGDWKGNVSVVLNPGVRPGSAADAPADADGKPLPPAEAARALRMAGVTVAIKPVNDADLKDMLFLGGLFTSHNPPADVLKMLTSDVAAVLGVQDRVGALAAGKDADFVVLNGDPFGLHTRVKAVYVEGKLAHEAKVAAKAKVVRAGRVLTGAGESFANGALLIEGRTVRGIGRDVSSPADAEVKTFPRGVIVPGFLDLGTGLGLGGPAMAVPLGTKLGDRLAAHDAAVVQARQGGVTTALLLPNAQQPAPVLAFKLADRPRAIADPVAVHLAVRGNLTSAGQQLRGTLAAARAYADGWSKYESDLKEYEKKKADFEAAKARTPAADEKKDEKKPEEPKAPDKPQTVEAMQPYRALFAGRIPALVEAKREDAIRLAVTICRDEFKLRTILVGADDAHRVVDLLAPKQVSVITGPELVRTVERAEVNLPLALSVRGVPVGFQSQATTGSRHLPLAVSYAVRHGLGADDALQSLTAGAAKLLGLENVGTLAVGKDADLVVLSGPPFELSTRVLAVMIDGEWVYQSDD